MKRLFYILLLILAMAFGESVCAQEVPSHLCRMISYINNLDYVNAYKEMLLVEEWPKDVDDKCDHINLDRVMSYSLYVEAMGANDTLQTHYIYYLSKEVDYYSIIFFFVRKDFESAMTDFAIGLQFKQAILPEDDPEIAFTRMYMGMVEINRGNYKEAEKYLLLANQVLQNWGNEYGSAYLACLNSLGLVCQHNGNNEEAEKYYGLAIRQAANLQVNQYMDDLLLTGALSNIGTYYQGKNQFALAEDCFLKALSVYNKWKQAESPTPTLLYSNLGNLYRAIGDFEQAKDYLNLAIEEEQKWRELGVFDLKEHGGLLLGVGTLLSAQGKYAMADAYFMQAEDILEKNADEVKHLYISLLLNRGNNYKNLQQYDKAEQYYLKALQICEQASLLIEVEQYPIALINIGEFYVSRGQLTNAEPYFQRALHFYETSSQNNSIAYTSLLLSIGNLYIRMGQHYQFMADDYFLRAEVLTNQQIINQVHPNLANNLFSIGIYYDNIGNDELAIDYYLRAIAINDAIYGNRDESNVTIYNQITTTAIDVNKYELAKAANDSALIIVEYNSQVTPEARADTYMNTSSVYLSNGQFSEAVKYAEKAYRVIQETPDFVQTDTYHMILSQLAVIDYISGNYVEAYEINKKLLLWIYTKEMLKHSHLAAKTKQNMGEIQEKLHQLDGAESWYREAFETYKTNYIISVNFLSEKQREFYWNAQEYIVHDVNNFVCHNGINRPQSVTLAYDSELFSKGILLQSINAVRRSILESGDSILIQQWQDLVAKKEQVQVLAEKNSSAEYLSQLQTETESLEKEITRSSATYRENLRQWNITWDSVRAVLKPKQVAIEFMRAPLNEDSTMYCALLLRHDSEYPQLIPLFEEKQVTKLLHNSTGDSAKINKTYQFEHNGDTLTRLIWGNILPYIHKGEEIYISPTHLLHQIAIEHLPYDETHTMNEVYSIVRLSSTRELVLPEKPIPHKLASLYGGILYDTLSADIMWLNRQTYAQRDMTSADSKDSQRRLTGLYAKPLYATQDEVDAIAPILKSQKISVTIYSSFSACEESVKALSGKKQNILHFATHGVYVDTLTTNDPLERCILTFAGVNRALRGDTVPDGTDDGLLTAQEISVLDFRDADIVVMSACETGLGDVSGEGVFGLQRAFKMAGAQTILMALWQVDDDATQMLMTAFYRYYSKGMSKREAFRKAQQEVRSYTEKKTVERIILPTQQEIMANQGKILEPKMVVETVTLKPYEAPYFWAGFILLD